MLKSGLKTIYLDNIGLNNTGIPGVVLLFANNSCDINCKKSSKSNIYGKATNLPFKACIWHTINLTS